MSLSLLSCVRVGTFLLLFALAPSNAQAGVWNAADFGTKADGVTDDTSALTACFAAAAKAGGGTITIPAGEYFLSGEIAVPLSSHLTVSAYGARFLLPPRVGDRARLVTFSGENVSDFRWFGGHFVGHVFDPAKEQNGWEPNANTRGILLTTTPGGRTEGVTFRDVTSQDLAGAAITVLGAEKPGNEREVVTPGRHITVENCTLERTGKFMWDYGLLWQITVWPEDFSPREQAWAKRYFRNDLVRPVTMADGDDHVRLLNRASLLAVATSHEPREAICFFGGDLPRNVVRGRQYFIVESGTDFVRIAEQPGGAPISFQGASGQVARMVRNLQEAHLALYAPSGSGPGKGALDVVGCEEVIVRGCRLSALGDTMHIQKCRNIVFSGNQITGSRMGAFFLAEYCRNAVISGNTVDGTNGSRVMSVEKSCEDVTITGNTFRGGGRGSWINQPRNFVLTGNIFINNTTKNEPNPQRGRRSFATGHYETSPELYFTLHEQGGRYGPVVVRDNLFLLGDACGSPAVTFAAGGEDLAFSGNTFRSSTPAIIRIDPSCVAPEVKENRGAQVEVAPVAFHHGRR